MDSVEKSALSAPRPNDRCDIKEGIIASLSGLVLSIAFSYPVIRHLSQPGASGDWDFSLELQDAAYHSLTYFHQLPLWNPYKCGGMPLFGNPQSHFFSPWVLLTLLFGPFVGLHLEIPAHFFVAWLGTYALGRVLSLRPLAAGGAACVFACSSWLNLHACEGHMVFLPIAYTPAIMALCIAGARPGKIVLSIAAGALLALTFFEGSAYPPIFIGVLLLLVIVPLCVTGLSLRPMWSLIVAGLFAAGFVAIKLLPAYELISSAPRQTSSAYFIDWTTVGAAFFSHNQDKLRFSPNWGFQEKGAYIGLFALPALLGLFRLRRALPWVLAIVVIILLARGDHGQTSLWVYFHRLPVVGSSMRLPSRFMMMATLPIGILAGLGFDLLLGLQGRRASVIGASLVVLVLSAAVVDNFIVVTPNLNYVLGDEAITGPPNPIFRQYQMPGPGVNMYRVEHENMGVLHCYEYTDNPWPTHVIGADEPGYLGEQYMLGPGHVSLTRWTPNQLDFQVDSPAASVLIVNQNPDPEWRVVRGLGEIDHARGLLAVDVPAGRQEIVLKYGGRMLRVGALISLLTVLLAGLIIWRPRISFQREARAARVPDRA